MAIKEAIQHDTGLANTILHLHGGLFILLLARVASGRSLGSFVPFSAVLALEIANEVIDWSVHGSWRWHDTASDLLHTLFWPLVLSAGVRLRPLRSPAGETETTID